jgi:hypothetical protein
LLESQSGLGSALRVVGLVSRGVEDDHDRVAGEVLDHPAVLAQHDRHGSGPVAVEHLEHLGGRVLLRVGREALEIREEHRDLSLLASELCDLGLRTQAGSELR